MANNREKRITKPIGFRLESETIDAISKAAKEKGCTIQDYFLSQIQPGTELSNIIQAERNRAITHSQTIENAKNRMADDALKIRESLGLSEKAFEKAAIQALKILLKKSDTDTE